MVFRVDSIATATTTPPSRFALWNLGFRPFFLFASAFAAIAIAAWVAQFAGWMGPYTLIAGPLWHAHEMVFGYAFAVIVGFLFTAVGNWTGRPTPTGMHLATIVGLWLAARLLVPTPWHFAAMAFDAAFAVAAAVGIARPLFASGNRRNYFFVALLLGLGVVNTCFYLAMAGVLEIDLMRAIQLALDLILFVMVVVGGRVIPMFTANAVPGAKPRRVRALELAALGSALALLVADILSLPASPLMLIAGVAAVLHAVRFALWQPWRTFGKPILWILHAAYAWIIVYLALRACAAFDLVSVTIADHALTVGGIGSLTLGMMTRIARGHTGRPLVAGNAEVTVYVLMLSCAAVRVLVPLLLPQFYLDAVIAAGALWVVAFLVFAGSYAPILWRPRADGRAG